MRLDHGQGARAATVIVVLTLSACGASTRRSTQPAAIRVVASVRTDLQDLRIEVASAKLDVAAVVSELSNERTDLARAKADLQRVLNDRSDQACVDADAVTSDAGAVATDLDTVSADNLTVTNDLTSTLANVISQTRRDANQLHTVEASLPAHQPPVAPTATAVSRTLESAQSASTRLRQRMNAYIAQANRMLHDANGYSAQAYTRCKQAGG